MGGSQSRYIDSPSVHKMKFSVTTAKCAYNAGSAKWDCVTTRTSTPNNAANAANVVKNTNKKNINKNKNKAKKASNDEYFTFFE